MGSLRNNYLICKIKNGNSYAFKFKFVKLKDAGMSADQAKKLSEDALKQLPEIARQIKDGEKQVREYGNQLEQRHGNRVWGLKDIEFFALYSPRFHM